METIKIREKLHQYIDLADERKIEAIYIMLEDEIASYDYNMDEIELFHERRERHLAGKSQSYTLEQSLKIIRDSKR